MHFSVYLEEILNKIEIMISAAHMLGAVRGHVPPRKFEKKGAIWFVLMYILIRYCLEKLSIFHVKK